MFILHKLAPAWNIKFVTLWVRRTWDSVIDSALNVRVWFRIYRMSWDAVGRSRWMVQIDVRCWSDTRTWTRRWSVRGTSAVVETLRHWCQSVQKTLRHRHRKVRHFGTKDIVPNCLRSEVSWVWSVRTRHTPLNDTQMRAGEKAVSTDNIGLVNVTHNSQQLTYPGECWQTVWTAWTGTVKV